MKISIRRGQSEDAKILFRLASQYVTGRESITRDEFTIALDNILRYREQEANVLFVAELLGEVVGYSLLTVSRLLHAPGLTAHLQEIVVDEKHRKQGIGERLMEANEHYCMGRGVRQISAMTSHIGNFYNGRDFQPIGQHYRKILEIG
ncbi:GNAT family N-acetyltransferase [Canibacter sp. lx-45]|uniref:GNAT family N-acetyltransferase n=1 Tax=Canibacter zhuwentaonis TaxID=2837491 RepID=UPI001BDCE9CD|nr:GNAT family N-acetyltransferase [Canibacter zhuwentaonis]MBT1035014.1 GNAT family N-acetyltransferase [Canibacter zhuwentaonis]